MLDRALAYIAALALVAMAIALWAIAFKVMSW